MHIEIQKLTPALVEDYIHFFDTTPHNQKRHNVKCYCVFWCSDDCTGKDFHTKAARRDYAAACVRNGTIQGYMAYYDGQVVGWCNANTKSDCLTCRGWLGMNGPRKGFIPTEEATPEIRVKSVFCFAIAPKLRRQGIASALLARVCEDAAADGFDFVEAYPDREITAKSEDFVGYADMYKNMGFRVYAETSKKLIMRKALK